MIFVLGNQGVLQSCFLLFFEDGPCFGYANRPFFEDNGVLFVWEHGVFLLGKYI